MCSETSPPRISFSSDLGHEDIEPVGHHQSRRDTSLLDMNCDFEFSFTSSCGGHESSSADELFSHGVILPTQPRSRVFGSPKPAKGCEKNQSFSLLPPLPSPKKDGDKEAMVVSSDMEEQKPQSSKSFWGFKRSSSLNCENKTSLLCSLPLLLRSNSTGSVSNPKRSLSKDLNKQGSKKQPSISMAKSASVSSSSSSSSISNPYTVLQKPPSKKNNGGSYANGVRIIPVINVPPPYISKGTAKFFGLGSFLHHGKDKRKK